MTCSATSATHNVAMTATAAAPVRDDIVERLRLRRPRVVVTGFGRDNLELRVERCLDADEQSAKVVETVLGTAGAGIVYCRTRKAAEEHAELLRDRGVRAAVYHGGSPRRHTATATRRSGPVTWTS